MASKNTKHVAALVGMARATEEFDPGAAERHAVSIGPHVVEALSKGGIFAAAAAADPMFNDPKELLQVAMTGRPSELHAA